MGEYTLPLKGVGMTDQAAACLKMRLTEL